jgi:Porin subfamily
MKMIKTLVLSSAAGLVAMSGAQAADLPVKAKAVEYVRICSLYGAGFYYIPGTDTCVKIGGYLRAEVNVHGGNNNQPFLAGDPAVNTRYENQYNDYARMAVTIDTRTATEYGVVRTFGQFDNTFATEGVGNSINVQSSLNTASLQGAAVNNYAGGGYSGLEFAFVQFAGWTLGKSASAFNTPWHGYPGNNTSFLGGGYDTVTGIVNAQYTAQFGNGFSATVGVDDSSANDFNRTQVFNATLLSPTLFGAGNNVSTGAVAGSAVTANNANCNLGGYGGASSNCTSVGTAYSGTQLPDVVGNIRVDQAWGMFQLSGALHDVSTGYWTVANTLGASQFIGGTNQSNAQSFGHPDSKLGGAVSVAFQFKNIPTGAGDDIKIEGTASWGASKYVLGTSGALGSSFYLFGSSNAPPLAGSANGTAGKIALGAVTDAVYGGFGTPLQAGVQLTQGWGFRGAFNHNWNPEWSTSLFGAMSGLSYNQTAKNLWCASYTGRTPNGAAIPGISPAANGAPMSGTLSADFRCDPGFTVSQIGITNRWTPVKNLTFSSEVMYTFLQTNMRGSANGTMTSAWPLLTGSTFQYASQGTVSANFRVQRNF